MMAPHAEPGRAGEPGCNGALCRSTHVQQRADARVECRTGRTLKPAGGMSQ